MTNLKDLFDILEIKDEEWGTIWDDWRVIAEHIGETLDRGDPVSQATEKMTLKLGLLSFHIYQNYQLLGVRPPICDEIRPYFDTRIPPHLLAQLKVKDTGEAEVEK